MKDLKNPSDCQWFPDKAEYLVCPRCGSKWENWPGWGDWARDIAGKDSGRVKGMRLELELEEALAKAEDEIVKLKARIAQDKVNSERIEKDRKELAEALKKIRKHLATIAELEKRAIAIEQAAKDTIEEIMRDTDAADVLVVPEELRP